MTLRYKDGALLFLTVIILSSSIIFAADYQKPLGVEGYVHYVNGSQVESGMSFRLNNTRTETTVTGTTGGPTGHEGWYGGVLSDVAVGDLVIVRAWNSTHYGEDVFELNEDTVDKNLTLNISNPAPYIAPLRPDGSLGVWVTPANPTTYTDIVCNYDMIGYSGSYDIVYKWYKNSTLQNFEVAQTSDSNTMFLASYDASLNADEANLSATAQGSSSATIVSTGKYGSSLNLSGNTAYVKYLAGGMESGDPAATRNLNNNDGTIQMWVRPAWAGTDAGKHYLFEMQFKTGLDDFFMDPLLIPGVDIYADNGNLYAALGESATDSYSITSWSANEWHHIAVTWQKSNTGEGTISLYVDGAKVGTASGGIHTDCDGWNNNQFGGTPEAPAITYNHNFTLGNAEFVDSFDVFSGNHSGPVPLTVGFDGLLDDFKITDTIFTDAQIASLFDFSTVPSQQTTPADVWQCGVTVLDGALESNTVSSDSVSINGKVVTYTLSDSTGNSTDSTLMAGKPMYINVSLTDSGTPVSDFKIILEEIDALNLFAPPQKGERSIVSKMAGEAEAVDNTAGFVFIPTYTRNTVNNTYQLLLKVYQNDALVYSTSLGEPSVAVGGYSATDYVGPNRLNSLPNIDQFSGTKFFGGLVDFYDRFNKWFEGVGQG